MTVTGATEKAVSVTLNWWRKEKEYSGRRKYTESRHEMGLLNKAVEIFKR